jgi:predicted ATPase/signal transduction histidine kinase
MDSKSNFPDFQILQRVSDGKAATVDLAKGPHGLVYLKSLKSDFATPTNIAKLRNEFDTQRRIFRVELREFEGTPVLVTPAVPSSITLEELLEGRPLQMRDFLPIALSISSYVARMHEAGVVHKDLNPRNIMVSKNSEAQIINFDYASCLEIAYQEARSITSLEGTLDYISPEQTQRMNRPVDYRTDLYSLGVVFYQMVCGRLPFRSDDPMDLIYSHIAKPALPPHDVYSVVPQVVSNIIMKLMSKNAEDRYNSAFGLKRDLEKCLSRLSSAGLIENFEIGKNDISRRLQIPAKLYGREAEKNKLISLFEAAARGQTQFILVSGYSGIGKTALVNEINKPATAHKGFFVSGKYEQFQNQAPYSAIVKAMGHLLQGLLSEPPQKIALWRSRISDAVGIHGSVLTDVIPELESVIGPQPPVALLSINESKLRFQRVFRNFMAVFATKDHPLAIFLDDLQWVDPGSLELLQLMLTKTQFLCVIGSYRENEMTPHHPLRQMRAEVINHSVPVHEITLKPLKHEDLSRLLSDSLYRPAGECSDLAQLILEKTGGNPFFVNEFLRQLSRVKALKINEKSIWTWNLEEIAKLNVTDNVVQLMTERIRGLPARTIALLKLSACAGKSFRFETIAAVNHTSLAQTIFNFSDAIREGLLVSGGDFSKFESMARSVLSGAIHESVLAESLQGYECRFLHDRIQQACYELTTPFERAELHYRIGRMMLDRSRPDSQDDEIITIVNHMNCARELFENDIERRELASLNLRAAQKAKQAAAYAIAAEYASTGLLTIGEQGWTTDPQNYLELHILCGESKALLGHSEEGQALLQAALEHAPDKLTKGRIFAMRISNLSSLGKYNEAVTCGIEAIKMYDFDMPSIDDKEKIHAEFIREYGIYRKYLSEHPVETLYDLPVSESPEHIQAMNLLTSMLDAAIIGPSHYLGIIALNIACRCMEEGNTEQAASGYSWLGVIEVSLGNYNEAYSLGELSLRMLEDKFEQNSRLGAHLNMFATFHSYLRRPSRDSYALWERSYHECMRTGDVLYAAYSSINGARQSIMWNASTLTNADEFLFRQMTRIDQLSTPAMAASIRAHLGVIHALRGNTSGLDSIDYDGFSEQEYRNSFAKAPLLISLVQHFRLMLEFFRGDFHAARLTLESTDFSPVETFVAHAAEYRFFGILTYSSLCAEVSSDQKSAFMTLMKEWHSTLAKLAESCPENFLALERIAAAEISINEGGSLEDGLMKYEAAIKSARDGGFMNFMAIALERAARLCNLRQQSRIGNIYLLEAHRMYAKWGAVAKAKQIEKSAPHLFGGEEGARPLAGEGNLLTSQSLDLTTALNAAKTMSGEIVQEKLLVKMMKTMRECGGAQIAVLALDNAQGETIVRVRSDAMKTELTNVPLEEYQGMSLGIVRFVQRTQQILSLNDAARDDRFKPDPYIRANQTKSALCLPVQAQGRTLGYLYMENNLAERAFNDDRVELLKMLASQAAISLENSALYADMEQRVQDRTQELNQSIANLKAAQAQLAQSSKMSALGQMAGGIAHEINTPLAIVQLQAETIKELVSEGPQNEKAIQSGLDVILQTSDRVAKIVAGLRSFSRDGSQDSFETTSIRQLFEQTLALCNERFQKENVTVYLEDIDPSASVPCRATEISQVILNLFNNSFDATENLSERWIRVTVTETAKDYKIHVTDSGPGIPETSRVKLFEPFFTTKPVGKGTGLGLPISQGILRKHGGDLYLDTHSPNTSFVIQLLKNPITIERAA